MRNSILIVDDEVNVISSLKRALIDEPYEIFTANSGIEGIEVLRNNRIKVIISDERMPGMSGAEFFSKVKEIYPDTVRIMLTGHASIESAMKAVNSGEIYRFFKKPWDDIELKLSIHSAMEKYNLEEENRKLLETIKLQSLNLRLIEEMYPNISKIERDEDGCLVIPDMSKDELKSIVEQCEREFS
ncbi:MAG: response regulator [Nitrospirota bacterium]|nr:response regulator [Nitrospirota bacterium]